MPGFKLGLDKGEEGTPLPAKPVYSYTWKMISMPSSGSSIPDTVYLRELVLPEYNINTQEAQGASSKYKYAESISWNDSKVTFYDTDELHTYLEQIKANVWSPETGIQMASKYKFDSSIEQYFADDQTLARTWTLHGSWIRGIARSNLTYTQSEVHSVTVTLAYDWAEVK